jgi:hypothetical protein|tara:strand:+ start:579 stop:3725 length:3147 start_codon:yes stop_codon:yes gene_type:complete
VADYGVNIAVAVKNTQAITKLSRDTDLLGQKIKNVNDALEKFGNLNGKTVVNSVASFNKELAKAAENFNNVRLGSDRAADAARNFARAQDLANEALREQAALLAEVRNQGRSGTLRGGTQYGGPIGPGPASPTALSSPLPPSVPVVLKSPMRPQSLLPQMGMTAQAGKIASDMEDVYASILRLTEKANQEEAEKLQTLRKGTEEVEKLAQKYRTVTNTNKTQKQIQLEIRRNILETKQAAAEEARIASRDYLDRLSSIEGIGKKRRDQMILANRELATEAKINEILKKREERAATADKKKRASGSALIGGAFPLLFGQGLGASVGGAAGGFAGGMIGGEFGFGLSLVGTAIGQAFDDAQRRVKEMGNALRTLDLSKLEESAIRVSEELKFQVEKLKEAGNFARARALLEETVAQQTGSTATVIKDIANSGNLLKAAFDEVVASGSVLLGAVAAPFSAALAGILKLVAEIFKVINGGIAVIGGLLREVEKIIDPGRNIQKAIESIAPAVTEATAEMKKFAEELRRSLALAQQTADLDLAAARIGPSDSAESQLARNRVEYQRQLSSIQQDINSRLKEAAKLTGQARIDALGEIKLLEAKNKRAAELSFIGNKVRIQLQERLRLQQELLDVDRRRSEAAQARLQRINQELAALRKRQQIEQEVLNLPIAAPTPFTGPTPEMIKQQKIDLINRNKLNQLDDLRAQNLAEEVRKDKEATIEAQAQLDIGRINLDFANKRRQAQEGLLLAAQNEIELIDARMAGKEAEVLIDQQIRDIQRTVGELDATEIANLKEKLSLLEQRKQLEKQFNLEQQARLAGAGLQAGFIGKAGQAFESTLLEGGSVEEAQKIAQLTEEMVLAQTEAAALEQAVLGIGNAFATTMTTGVQELVAGTKSAEEVFADFLRNVANMLMQAAQQIIATYIAIGIAKIFAGMGGGSGDSLNIEGVQEYVTTPFNAGDFTNAFTPKALGGAVGAGQPYLVGEKGPELFVPGAQGNIVPNSGMGGSNIVVNVDASGSSVEGDAQQSKALGQAIGAAVQAEIVKQKMPGGLLN